ncbi:MAG: outer membrane beta-barrel family protein [Paramuribaculum sp.]|nr:outer membrane beta-barrel family protein [Paramuribaculum sp.]
MKTRLVIMVLIAVITQNHVSAQNLEATDSLTRELQEIVVNARQPATKLVGSTLVTTIPGSNLSELGNALDVLAQLPLIKVKDKDVSVIGKNNVEIYIDGRPMHDEFELQNILSSDLSKVELMMFPGAMYDSNTDAVIKIMTKRSFSHGISFTNQLQIQCRRKVSVMDYLGISYNVGNWELFFNGMVNRTNSLIKGTTTNSFLYGGKDMTVGSTQNNSYPTTVGSLKTGMNYSKGSQSAGVYYRYNPERGNFKNKGVEWLDDNPRLFREIDKQIRAYSHQVSGYYENTFAGTYLLHADGDFRHSVSHNGMLTFYPGREHQDVKSTDIRKSILLACKVYTKISLWRGDFTAGVQGSFTHTSLDYRMHDIQVGEYIPSSVSDSRQTSTALFVSWSGMFGNFSLSAGVRYEYVDYEFDVNKRRDDDVSRRSHNITPDLSLGYSFNDNTQLTLSYRLSRVKPPYSQLTGALGYVGVHEIEGGNPALRDEIMNDLQLLGMWNGFMIQTDFIRSLDTYAYVKKPYSVGHPQLMMRPENIDVAALSFYLVWSKPIKLWTPNITAGIYKQWLSIDNVSYCKPIYSYYFDNVFTLPGGWNVTANISGRSQGDMHTNRFAATWFTMDASVGKTFFNKTLNVKLSATDVFNTANHDWTMYTYGVFVNKCQSYDYRGVSLNVTYTFQPRKSNYKGNPAAEEELRRL